MEGRLAIIPRMETRFFPRGAIAFFAVLVGAYAVIWLLMMALMVGRA